VNSRFLKDVPFFVWSDSIISSPSYSIVDSVASSNLIPLVTSLLPNSEVVVIFYESQLQTYEVSSFNRPSSVFSMIQQQLKTKNSVTIPYVFVNSIFPSLLAKEIQGSVINYFTGESSAHFTDVVSIPNLQTLKNSAILSNGVPDLLIIELNHNEDSLHSKFERSGKIMKEVEFILKDVKHTSIYTGLPPSFSILDKTFMKRSVGDFEEVFNITPLNDTKLEPIQPIASFNYWFPGWFWEIATIIILISAIGSFGIYQLFSLPVTLKLATPKKIKNL